jgi:hypothetical protein
VQNNSRTASPAKHASNITHIGIGGACRGKNIGGANTRAMVVNVTVAVAVLDPLSVTGDGETVHVDAAGAPVQPQVTVPLKLLVGAAVTV